MAKFNSKNSYPTPNATSYEGAAVYKRDPIQAWFNMLFSSFLENQYYETSKSQMNRFIELTNAVAEKYGYAFVGKAAIFARNELGMRSISQLTAAWLNDKKFHEKRAFYRSFMHRPDDVSEIFSAIDFLNGKRSHALIKGSADYLSSLGDYQITKYKMNGHKYNMYDLINLTHATSLTIHNFKHGLLDAPDTWEVNISKANDKSEREHEWKRMIEQGKLGYMALLRNLNNILDNKEIDHSWIIKYLCPQIMNKESIHKSLIFPYRIYTAYKNLNIRNKSVEYALDTAFILATDNVPEFSGKSAIVLDVSGSMDNPISARSKITLKEVGACFAATLILKNSDVDFFKFGTNAKSITFNRIDSAFNIINRMCENDNCGYGTDINSVIPIMKNIYDRIFLISDMQVFDNRYYWWGSSNSPTKNWNKKYHNTMTYSFDLANYNNQIESPSDNFMFLTSISDVLFKYINLVEGNNNLVNIINNINFH